MDEVQVIDARLDAIIFRNESNGYTVAKFFEKGKRSGAFIGCGIMDFPMPGRTYQLTGKDKKHPKYGSQFNFSLCELSVQSDKESLIHFFSSGTFKGVGKKAAEKIVDTFGSTALDTLVEDPDKVDEIEQLNPEQKRQIKKGIELFSGKGRILVELIRMGVSQKQIELLQQKYKDHLSSVLTKNCFMPVYDIKEFSLQTCNLMADGFGYGALDERRIDAVVFDHLRKGCFESGDTWLAFEELLSRVAILSVSNLQESLNRLSDQDYICWEQGRISLRTYYDDEVEIAWRLKEHLYEVDSIDPSQIESAIANIEEELGIQYDEKQKKAMMEFFNRSLMILNGGPGTGKSTVVKGILMLCRKFFPSLSIQLCAPTGKASKRLKQLSSANSRTIHSLLAWDVNTGEFGHNESNPLEHGLLIVDEFSMVDTHLFASLLRALPRDCRILLIGDEEQLESVGPGRVFNDIVESNLIKVETLQTVFRQREGSGIVDLADEIRHEKTLSYENGVHFESLEGENIVARVEQLVNESVDPSKIQLLAPMYKGVAGIDALNKKMQELLNPFVPSKKQIPQGEVFFRQDDKVMLTQNMPEQNVFNGDMGDIVEVDEMTKTLVVEFDGGNEVVFPYENISKLSHAWCMSVHKSQGSEYPLVILALDQEARRMLERRLLYTGISRAKKELYILGDRGQFENGCRRMQARKRKTSLKERLLDFLSCD